jgi:anti-anti-sigma factor
VPTLTTPADPDQLLSVTTVRDERAGRVVVDVAGEVDAYTAPLLDACLRSQSRQRELRELVVDLADVDFLGAAGIRVLARAGRRCRLRGARLVILTGGRAALRPLELGRLTDCFAVDPGVRRHTSLRRHTNGGPHSAARRAMTGPGAAIPSSGKE